MKTLFISGKHNTHTFKQLYDAQRYMNYSILRTWTWTDNSSGYDIINYLLVK